MSYYTYFKGELEIKLSDRHLNILKSRFDNIFKNEKAVILDGNRLSINDEWVNSYDSLEKIISYIEEHGKLKSGTIRCDGEDQKDVWEIFISENKPFIKEIGSRMTLNRSVRMQQFLKLYDSNKDYIETYRIINTKMPV